MTGTTVEERAKKVAAEFISEFTADALGLRRRQIAVNHRLKFETAFWRQAENALLGAYDLDLDSEVELFNEHCNDRRRWKRAVGSICDSVYDAYKE